MSKVDDNLAEGNEEVFDFNCSKCEEDEKFVEAISYCPMCPSYLCRACLQQHRRFLKDHATLGENRKEDWGRPKVRLMTGHECATHEGQPISMFCVNHDALCCPICVSLDHRNCRGMSYIPKIAKGILQSDEYQQLQSKIDQILADIEIAVTTKKADETNLKDTQEKVLKEIAALREKINTALDKLEEEIRKKVSDVYKPVAEDIADDLTACAQFGEVLQEFKNELQKANNTNESDLFIKMKISQRKMSECEEIVRKCSVAVNPTLTFMENVLFLDEIERETNLGEIEYQSDQTNRLYNVSKCGKVNVSLPDDKCPCYVDGLCQMPNGQIIVADRSNNRIKILDSSYKVKRACCVPDQPSAVCCTSETEIAVTLANQTVQFLDISDDMFCSKSIKLGHNCLGLAYHDGKLYVTDKEKRVYIYDMSGARLRTIQRDSSSTDIFSDTRHIAVSTDGSRLYVTEREKGLIVLDSEGKHVSTFESPELTGSRGVCIDTHGNVFLICCRSHNIAQLDAKGENIIGIVVEKKHGIRFPGIAVFDKVRSALLITSGMRSGCNELDVCYIQPV